MNLQCAIFIALAIVSFVMAQLTYKPAPKPKLVYHVCYVVQAWGENQPSNYYHTTVSWASQPDALQMQSEVVECLRKANPEHDGKKLMIFTMTKLETK